MSSVKETQEVVEEESQVCCSSTPAERSPEDILPPVGDDVAAAVVDAAVVVDDGGDFGAGENDNQIEDQVDPNPYHQEDLVDLDEEDEEENEMEKCNEEQEQVQVEVEGSIDFILNSRSHLEAPQEPHLVPQQLEPQPRQPSISLRQCKGQWKDLSIGSKEYEESIAILNSVRTLLKQKEGKVPFGCTHNNKTIRCHLELMKQFMQLVGGNSLRRFLLVLLADEETKKVIIDILFPEMEQKLSKMEQQLVKYKELLTKLSKIRPFFRENLLLIFKSIPISSSSCNELVKLIRDLISKATGDPKLARQVTPQLLTQLYKNRKNPPLFTNEIDLLEFSEEKNIPVSEILVLSTHGTLDYHGTIKFSEGELDINLKSLNENIATFDKPEDQRKVVKISPTKWVVYIVYQRKLDKVLKTLMNDEAQLKRMDISLTCKVGECNIFVVAGNELTGPVKSSFDRALKPFVKQEWLLNWKTTGKEASIEHFFFDDFKPSSSPKNALYLREADERIPTEKARNACRPISVSIVSARAKVFKEISGIVHLLKENLTEVIVKVDIFSDGTTGIGSPLITKLLHLFIDGKYTKSGEDIYIRQVPIAIFRAKEAHQTSKTIQFATAEIIAPLLLSPLKLKEKTDFTCELELLPGDNKGLWLWLCKFLAGHKRCAKCVASFHEDCINDLFQPDHFMKLEEITPHSVFNFFEANKSKSSEQVLKEAGKKYGIASSPYFFVALHHFFSKAGQGEKFLKDVLPRIVLVVDNLHNIRGWLIFLIECLLESKRLDESMFKNRLLDRICRNSLSDCNGTNARQIIQDFKFIITGSLVFNANDTSEIKLTPVLERIFDNLQVISWIVYACPLAHSFKGIRLLLHFACFDLALAADELPKEIQVMNLFLHMLVAHLADDFEKFPSKRTTTEDGEQFMSFTKRILRWCTSRHLKQALNEVFLRREAIQLKDQVQEKSSKKKEDKPNKKFKAYHDILKQMEDKKIYLTKVNKGSATRSIETFTNKLRKLEYNEEYLQYDQEKQIWTFFVKNDVLEYLKKKGYDKEEAEDD